MDFNKLNNVGNNAPFQPLKKEAREKTAKTQNEETKADEKKSPANPQYWQNIAFGNLKKTETKTPQAIAQEGREALDDIFNNFRKSAFRISDEECARAKDKFELFAPYGKEALEAYSDACLTALVYSDASAGESFMELSDVLLEALNGSETSESPKDIMRVMLNISRGVALSNEERKEFFRGVLNAEGTFKEKADWYFNLYQSSAPKAMHENLQESINVYRNYVKDASEDEKKSLFSINPQESTMKAAAELFDSGIISTSDISECIKDVKMYSAEDREAFEEIVKVLREKIIDEHDESVASYFNNLRSPALSQRKLNMQQILELLKENDSNKKEMVNWFVETASGQSGRFFGSDREFFECMDILSAENCEDFKTCYSLNNGRGKSSVYELTKCVNPRTNKFNKNIFDEISVLDKKNELYRADLSSWYQTRSSEIAVAMLDEQTGEISQTARDFTDKYYYEIENNSGLEKIKNAIKSAKRRGYYSRTLYKENESFKSNFATVLNLMKDKNGTFNRFNVKCMSKVAEIPYSSYDVNFSFFDSIKDENGVVDKQKFKFAMEMIKKTGSMSKVSDVMSAFEGKDFYLVNKAYSDAIELFGKESVAMNNFATYAKYCMGDEPEKRANNEFVKELVSAAETDISLTENIIKASKEPSNKEFLLNTVKQYKLDSSDIDSLSGIIINYADSSGKLNKFAKKKLEAFLDSKIPLYTFRGLYDACVTDKNNPQNNFKEDVFKKVTALYTVDRSAYSSVEPKLLLDFLENQNIVSTLKFKDKTTLLNVFVNAKDKDKSGVFNADFLNDVITLLDKNLKDESIFLPVEEEFKKDFIDSVLGSKNSDVDGRNEFDNVLKNSIETLENTPGGLNIKYSREKFLEDLTSLCDTKEKIQILKEKTGISPILSTNGGKTEITGYDGIILLDKLNKANAFEGSLYNTMHRFMYENEVMTGNAELDAELNKMIKACPEFINTIGKSQHGTHAYSLDIHSLLVLARSLESPEYSKLNPADKAMLKVACMFHDVAKQQNQPDPGHQDPSSIYTRSIVKKFFNNEESRDRVYELVKNHHWLEQYTTAPNKDTAAKETAYKFRRPNDYDIAKIMAKADLKSVSKEFYESKKHALAPEGLFPIEKQLENFYSTGCAIFSDYPIEGKLIQNSKQTKNGKEYNVINFHNIKNDEDVGIYGFENGKTKDDVNFLVHMVNDKDMKNGLRTVEMLTSSVNGGVLSESIISPKYQRTYTNRKYGVVLSQINANIVNMCPSNQGSGFEKDFNDIIRLTFGDTSGSRANFRKGLLEQLGIGYEKVSDKEFAKFYKENIVSKSRYSQFNDSKEYTLGGKTFTGAELKQSIQKYQNSLLDKNQNTHNEIVGYIPKVKAVIAKEKSINNVPDDLLEFAYENKLPVVLI